MCGEEKEVMEGSSMKTGSTADYKNLINSFSTVLLGEMTQYCVSCTKYSTSTSSSRMFLFNLLISFLHAIFNVTNITLTLTLNIY